MKSTGSKMLLILHMFSQLYHCIVLHFNCMQLHITAEDLLEMWILKLKWSPGSSQLYSCAAVPAEQEVQGMSHIIPRFAALISLHSTWPCCSLTSTSALRTWGRPLTPHNVCVHPKFCSTAWSDPTLPAHGAAQPSVSHKEHIQILCPSVPPASHCSCHWENI